MQMEEIKTPSLLLTSSAFDTTRAMSEVARRDKVAYGRY